jgi:DMSO/TMAO reductase YedYZ molybdopterin-dependent catalytic subunit
MTSTRSTSDVGHPRGRAALAGVLSGGLALAAAELAGAVVAPDATPLLAVGDAFVDLTPGWLKDLAIALFGTADKVALFAGMGAVVLGLTVLAGLLAWRRPRVGAALAGSLGLVAAVAAATRPGAGPTDLLPSGVVAVTGALVLPRLVHRLAGPPPAGDPAAVAGEQGSTGRAAAAGEAAGGRPPGGEAAGGEATGGRPANAGTAPDRSRRTVLAVSAAVAGVAVGAVAAGRLVGRAARDVASSRAGLRIPPPQDPAPPLPPGVDLTIDGLTPFQTPNPVFYRIDTALRVPRVDPGAWRLRVHGLVDREVELDFADLLDAGLVERWTTLTCVSNEVGGDLAGNALWSGVLLRDVLARAGPRQGADMVLSTSADGWTASTPLDVLTDDRGALLAVSMNGEPLPLEHGFPVRMVVPGLYGYVSATKWVVDLEVTTFAERTSYWTDRGWAPRGPVKTASRIDVPAPSTPVRAGRVVVAGVAWAQHRGIDAVEVQVDDGPWAPATLAAAPSEDTWRQWRWEWPDATAGQHRLRVRATDATGEVQTEERADPVPDGATGWHTVVVRVEA